jgi:hypothetical protein
VPLSVDTTDDVGDGDERFSQFYGRMEGIVLLMYFSLYTGWNETCHDDMYIQVERCACL